ncbi:MAG: glycoside hydrolase, partial [Acidobacteriaceae bacterium]
MKEKSLKLLGLAVLLCLRFISPNQLSAQTHTGTSSVTTAWSHHQFNVNVAGVIGRSNIVLVQPNLKANQAMPLGNGRLGVAVWSASGFTAQLNRSDTMPYRYSPGQVILPGLSTLTLASNYAGKLDLYDGEFQEQGSGMTAVAYVQPDTDTLIIDVSGANPNQIQSAQLKLWPPRQPHASVTGSVGLLSETWVDDKNPGASGRTFGSLSAITAEGRNLSSVVTDPLTITVSVLPYKDGHYRIIVAAPHYDGSEDAKAIAAKALRETASATHKLWWNGFWQRAGFIKITSPDGVGEYMENLRNIYLYSAAAESRGIYPGSQAGVADLFSSVKDNHHWDPSAFWHWNLRMQVAANLGAGLPELNMPYFNLYRNNLKNIENWTTKHMQRRPGICIPETMRFNGMGIEYEVWDSDHPHGASDCDAASRPYYNARTLSTGAEVPLWIWQQYLQTEDYRFLANNYPVIAGSARFLLAYSKQGTDGLMHTSPSNAHETQWDTTDPTTDIAAKMALYPVAIQAAKLLGKDTELVRELKAALPKIPSFPRVEPATPFTLLPASSDAQGNDVIADSYRPAIQIDNAENIGLEPVWPYNLIGDTSPLFALARRTYAHRPFPTKEDWSLDPIQAARLGLGSEVGSTLVKLTETYQRYVNGFANWGGKVGEFYV